VERNIRHVREYAFPFLLIWSYGVTPRCHTPCCCRSQLYIQGITECYSHYRVLRYASEELSIYKSMFHVSKSSSSVTPNKKSSTRHNIGNSRLTNSVSYITCRHIYLQSTLKGNTSLTALHIQINNQQNTQSTGKFTLQQATKVQSYFFLCIKPFQCFMSLQSSHTD